MTIFCCRACGTSFPPAEAPPLECPICRDARQYVPAAGQSWVSIEELAQTHRNAWQRHENGLFSIQTVPAFAINQRALLLQTPSGNLLWDCIGLLDEATEALIRGLGGLSAIAISHPHYYTTMQDWASAFEAPIYLHSADREWIARSSPWIRHWDGETLALNPFVNLIRAGGHFPGGTVLHWNDAEDGKGVLLVGDILQVTPGAHQVSFMWSYPNMLPLSAAEVRAVARNVSSWSFERIYGAFVGQNIQEGADEIVARSARQYIDRLGAGL
ncbi:MBL fold metallo-hydrolase [Neorhizobium sp. P12A]|uniref:MBL fold metallo-hydrolase n=1 Tax=Neorhizobium sp. P12A TaxID=2268027 RepID=UPI0011EE379E|nr:MBL fold metallo-hydrolase [Neorhizobium sp. P12A]KAA0693697.1 MBL fold metallo-hydrolase [Neorhizobium sp. P12A]